MRPVTKWEHTDMTLNPRINEFYDPYDSAKYYLELNIGGYCSYCEKPGMDEAIHVEHVQPKGLVKYAPLATAWSNFLLSCARCNGRDNKTNKDVIFGTVHLPHRNNTSISILYKEGGYVEVNPVLNGVELDNANALILLVGLHKRPGVGGHNSKDKRWDRRREVWEIAKRNLTAYLKHRQAHVILDLAKGYGFWSVWYTLYSPYRDVKILLVQEFSGTARNCFDANFDFINRNPGHASDTV